jgi:hypothetical protein
MIDASGPFVTFTYTLLGGCGNISFAVESTYSGTAFTPPTFVVSPDIDGDCQVSLADFIHFAGSYQTADPCCDYDCSGTVGLVDFVTFANHYLDGC